jgi:hypothetical protein
VYFVIRWPSILVYWFSIKVLYSKTLWLFWEKWNDKSPDCMPELCVRFSLRKGFFCTVTDDPLYGLLSKPWQSLGHCMRSTSHLQGSPNSQRLSDCKITEKLLVEIILLSLTTSHLRIMEPSINSDSVFDHKYSTCTRWARKRYLLVMP